MQLVAPLNEQSPLARFLDRAGPGVQHLAFRVSDVEHAAAEYRRRGLRLLYDAPKPGTRGSRINFVHPKDTGGVLSSWSKLPKSQLGIRATAFTP